MLQEHRQLAAASPAAAWSSHKGIKYKPLRTPKSSSYRQAGSRWARLHITHVILHAAVLWCGRGFIKDNTSFTPLDRNNLWWMKLIFFLYLQWFLKFLNTMTLWEQQPPHIFRLCYFTCKIGWHFTLQACQWESSTHWAYWGHILIFWILHFKIWCT